jgi:AcrR family transcriptional regulator
MSKSARGERTAGVQPGRRHTAAQPSPRVPIPRGDRARERILRAALEVLADQGLGGFSMEAVARRAGASKATVYRRWTSQSGLLVDAMDAGFRPFPLPSTGALRTDLIQIFDSFESLVTRGPFSRLMAAFIDAAEGDPTLWSLHVQLTEQRREPVRHLLAEGILRGEISPATDLEMAVDLLAGPAFYRRFVAHWPFPPGYAAAIVDLVLAAIGTDPGHKQRARNPNARRNVPAPDAY